MSKAYSYILFDLDGTLTDSGPGITNGFAYAVEKMGGQVEDKSAYRRFVGPPLRDSFEKVLGYYSYDARYPCQPGAQPQFPGTWLVLAL